MNSLTQLKVTRSVYIQLIKFILVVIPTLILIWKLNLSVHPWWLLALVSGLTLGLIFPWLDQHFFYQLYVDLGQFKGTLSQSLVFLATFLPLALFIVTSSSSPLGLGFVLGFLITSSVDLWSNLVSPTRFHQLYLYQFAREFAPDEQRLIAIAFTGVTLFISLLALI